jgi:phospholipid/cholesterol/gamma-HCH transport system substrate-binding protein
MSKESKIALLAILSFAILIIGYKFIIGKSILSKRQYFYVKYKDIDQLQVSNPVMINGFEVGAVNKIYLDPTDNITPIVILEVKEGINIPKDAKAVLASQGFLGGKVIQIKFNGKCSGPDCAQSGSYLEAGVKSFMDNLVGQDELNGYIDKLKSSASQIFDTVVGEAGKREIKIGKDNLEKTLANLAQSTTTLNKILAHNSNNLDKIIANLESVMSNIQKSNVEISGLIKNLNSISAKVSAADPGKILGDFDKTLLESKTTIEKLQSTLKSTETTMTSVNDLIKKASSGQGTAAKILNDPTLYQNLNNTSKQLELLLQDFRLNPKRYVNVSVFGKKQKEYVPNDSDPALKLDTIKHQ